MSQLARNSERFDYAGKAFTRLRNWEACERLNEVSFSGISLHQKLGKTDRGAHNPSPPAAETIDRLPFSSRGKAEERSGE
jgi:hypothetical protein